MSVERATERLRDLEDRGGLSASGRKAIRVLLAELERLRAESARLRMRVERYEGADIR